jgi:outer membrane cobalamin receptor
MIPLFSRASGPFACTGAWMPSATGVQMLALTTIVAASPLCAEDGTSAAIAPGPVPAAYPTPVMATLVVTGRSDSQIGIAQSAAQGSTGKADIEDRPMLRPAELLETVPGLIATAHSGDGKANQYFLRGFDLDHGTDFAINVDGIPVNLPGNAHGQGYSDLNFLIPEIVERVDYRKGPY